MAELNFIIDTDALATIGSTEISANFEEMKTGLSTMVEPYETMIVSEDGISDAKNDRAKLRKYAKAIDDYRKMVKNQAAEPYLKFESKCKELIAIIDRGTKNLDVQVKAFEEDRKQKKFNEIQNYFNNAPKEYPEFIAWGDVYNDKWGNVTYSIDDAKAEIDNKILRVDHDVAIIKSKNSIFEPALIEKYRETKNLYTVLDYENALIQRQKALDERRASIERQRAEREAQMKAAEEHRRQEAERQPIDDELIRQAEDEIKQQDEFEAEYILSEKLNEHREDLANEYIITIRCSEGKFKAVQYLCKDNGIEIVSVTKAK